ncbi:glycosyltransferase family protein [Microbaculum marinum]|uniref:Glycosyltransferase n=1 Tax=Microbaculum marinum TaxID=1764581 RepID=A0AAW9RSM9_9HYPH
MRQSSVHTLCDMPNAKPKILIYSHDSFGLGHLRRCRAIAHSLVGDNPDVSVMILSGSPIIGSFEFRSRVDFVRVPGVTKLRDGAYTSLSLPLDIEHTMAIRTSIIDRVAEVFEPDIFIVDKEPLGLRGEVRETLERLRNDGVHLVLGLRDVMDDPEVLREEWERKRAPAALEDIYDDIWVFGLKQIFDPLEGVGIASSVYDKTLFTGYLRSQPPNDAHTPDALPFGEDPFLLVTPGGGGDGVELVDWVIRAYEARTRPLFPALIILGPFMEASHQIAFMERAEQVRDLEVKRFTANMEPLLQAATGVVGMGGYNTFCEILSFNKPALLVPRVVPRQEQMIRALKAEEAGLLSVLPIDLYPDTGRMIDALARVSRQNPPSAKGIPGLLDGLDRINERAADILQARSAAYAPQSAAAS